MPKKKLENDRTFPEPFFFVGVASSPTRGKERMDKEVQEQDTKRYNARPSLPAMALRTRRQKKNNSIPCICSYLVSLFDERLVSARWRPVINYPSETV